jgi:signal transduction histidine kinase/CheY-like chemotaxis protein
MIRNLSKKRDFMSPTLKMKRVKLKNYLVSRSIMISLFSALLITVIFYTFFQLTNSLQNTKEAILLLKNYYNSISKIEETLHTALLPESPIQLQQLEKIIAREIEKTDFTRVYQIQKEYGVSNAENSIPDKQQVKQLFIKIEDFLKDKNNPEGQGMVYPELITSLTNFRDGINNLIVALASGQQETIVAYKKINILVWLGSLIIIHLLIIFLYRPMTKKITGEVEQLSHEKEEAITASRATSEFLATMSHEIRTPLNGVLGLTGLLLETRISQEQRDYLELVHDSGESLLQVVNDIFDFSNIESGVLKLEQMYFSIHSCVEEVVDTFLPKAMEKNIQLLHLIEPDVPGHILGDYKRTVQCLSNFVSNAVKFTRNGEILIRINLLNKIDNMCELQFSISDTGIGVPENKIKNLFTPFRSEKAPVAKRFEGSGLGLAICSKLVELMNGRIWVESEVNIGSTFYFAAHFQIDETASHIHLKKDIALLKEKHILILEANETVRQVLSVQNHNWGMFPKVYDSVETVIDVLSDARNLSFALLDLDLIERVDESALERIKRITNEKNIPVVLMRSKPKRKHNSDSYEGFVFIEKQVKQSQLYELLIGILNTQQSEEEGSDGDKATSRYLPLTLLLAEDNIINQKLMERFAARIGYEIDIAQNGVMAVKMATEKNYNIIFMDLQMPEMDGISATRQILKSQTDQLKSKIIAMTANVQTKDKELCFDAGMVDYITKPVSFEKIKYLLDYWGKLSLQDRK